jgi:hypothetical protein
MAEPDNLTEEAKNVKLVLDAVQGNPALQNTPEIKNLVDLASKSGTKEGAPPAPQFKESPYDNSKKDPETLTGETPETPPATPDPESAPTTETTAESPSEAPEETERASVFYKKEVKAPQTSFANINEVNSHVQTKYSIDTNDMEGWGKLFKSVDGWRKDAQKLDDAEVKLQKFNESFENMPDNLFNAVNAWANGDDYEKSFATGTKRFDYSKPFAEQDQWEMLNHYFPDTYTKDDLNYDDTDPTVKKGIQMAEKQYDFDRNTFEKNRAQYLEQAESKKSASTSSIKSSVEALGDVFPDMDKNAVNKIRGIMQNGDLSGLLLNKDGTWNQEAATKIAYMVYGEDEIKRRDQSFKDSQENLSNIVDRGATQPNVKGKEGAPLSSDVEGALKMFDGLVTQKHY